MIFEFSDKLTEISIKEITDKLTVAYFSENEFKEYHNYMAFDYTPFKNHIAENSNLPTETEVYDNGFLCSLRIIEPEIDNNDNCLIALYIKSESVIVIEASARQQRLRERFLEAVNRFRPNEYTSEKFIFAFIDSLIKYDNIGLESIEFDINRIEDKIISENDFKNFNEELLRYKRKLLLLRNYYKQIINICEVLSENDNKVFSKENIDYFKILITKAEKLCSEVSLLRESLVQLRETYQSHLDLKLNNTMKLFTIITAFFAPLTLIAGWYGMNFEFMPEIKWKYGYLFVIGLSICSVISCLIIFKRKKMM